MLKPGFGSLHGGATRQVLRITDGVAIIRGLPGNGLTAVKNGMLNSEYSRHLNSARLSTLLNQIQGFRVLNRMRLSLQRYLRGFRKSFAVIGLALLVLIAVAGQLCYSPMAKATMSDATAMASAPASVDPCCVVIATSTNCLAVAECEAKPALLSGNSFDLALFDQSVPSPSPVRRNWTSAPAFIVSTGPPLRRSVLYCRFLI